jgi:hypothetical protein
MPYGCQKRGGSNHERSAIYQRAIPLKPKSNTQVTPEFAIMQWARTVLEMAEAKLENCPGETVLIAAEGWLWP